MTLIAVIDIGTNTTRLLVRNKNVPKKDIIRKVEITRLGYELEKTGLLGFKGITDTKNAVFKFIEIAKDSGVALENIYIFATAASRNAQNGKDFIEELERETGCLTEIISGETEGQYSFAGAISGMSKAVAPCVVFDIGGGSTEFSISSPVDATVCEKVVSIPIGSVRITGRHLESDPPEPEELTNAISDIRDYLTDVEKQLPNIRRAKKWIGVAATVTTTASVEIGLQEFDAAKIHEYVLTREMVEEVFRTLATESLADRIHNPGLERQRADVIVGGLAIIAAIMRHFELSEITTSCTDLLDGLFLSVSAR